jgi:menaquinone-9 beta-reductase
MPAYDAIIIGARVAGATTALLLARRGYSVLLIDRDRFPSPVISTHVFFTDSMDVYEQIGVLDDVLAVDAPRLTAMRFPYVEGRFPDVSGRDFALCIRRETLDAIPLQTAGRHPSIEVLTGVRAIDLYTEADGRVTGVRFQDRRTGTEGDARARVVIGADSRYSFVARAVEADAYHDVAPLFAWYYGYFEDVPLDDPPSVFAARTAMPEIGADFAAAFVFPCDAGLTLVGFGVQHDRFRDFRQDHDANFHAGLATIPEVADRLAGARLVAPIVGTADLPNFFRTAAGPGWALVGDAGCHKDPHTIQGMGDAARSARMLAEEIDAWWRDEKTEIDAMVAYARRRDADLLPMYDFTTNRLQAELTEAEWEAFGEMTFERPDVASRRVAATAHAIDPAEIYSATAIRTLVRESAR